ncbi:MAG: PEP-CTERM sorting domain-containing protein [Sedimentisphaerales bacterium]|nr:PEP-CTERM sorting domain-containing protein [Sedimentisphaerales bacterium]
MKRFLLTLTLCAAMSTSAAASLMIEFSPGIAGGAGAGRWSYDGAGTLSFSQAIQVDLVNGSGGDALSTLYALVEIPTMTVAGVPGGPYTLSGGEIKITDSTGAVDYLTGQLGPGDLVPIGTTAVAYSSFAADITSVVVTTAGSALSSSALDYIAGVSEDQRHLDFELSLQGASLLGFKEMLDSGLAGSDGFSGAMTIPEPATLFLLGLGSLALLRYRKPE